jgi:hypothetical protein
MYCAGSTVFSDVLLLCRYHGVQHFALQISWSVAMHVEMSWCEMYFARYTVCSNVLYMYHGVQQLHVMVSSTVLCRCHGGSIVFCMYHGLQ